MTVFTRQDWGAQASKRSLAPVSGMAGFAVHHVGDGRAAPNTAEAAMAVLRNIQNSHLNHPTEDYSDIAYNVAVDQLGNRYVLRGIDRKGGATFGANDTVIACLWIGDSRFTTPTPEAITAIAAWYQEGVAIGALRNGAHIGGHGDYSAGTECPGPALRLLLPTIRMLAGGPTIDDIPLTSLEDHELNQQEKEQLALVAGVLGAPFPRFNRVATMADLMETLFVNFEKANANVAAQTAVNEQILATLRSIDQKLGAGAPGAGPMPTAADLVDAFIERLGRS